LKKDGDISGYIQDPDKPRWGLVVYRLPLKYCPISTYKKGSLSMGFFDSSDTASGDNLSINEFFSFPRKYLKIGEKVWISGFGIANKKNAVLAGVVTDPYDDGRYCGMLKFPFDKNHLPSPDDAVRMVSEVLAVQPTQNQPAPASEPMPEVSPAPVPMPDIAPPSPPPTIVLGQTKDQVIAGFGQPARVAKLGVKEIFYYKDMKVTFTNGKVRNVE
jgi:hypothetical protein